MEKPILKFIWNLTGPPQIAKTILKKEKKTEDSYFLSQHLLQNYSNVNNVVLA